MTHKYNTIQTNGSITYYVTVGYLPVAIQTDDDSDG